MRMLFRRAGVVACATASACGAAAAQSVPFPVPGGLDLHVPAADVAPITRATLGLGRRLFFDTRLSRDGTLSCASCHRPEFAFADTTAVSVGVGGARGRRNAPALVNRGYGQLHFWDGRATSLMQQVLEPIADPVELALDTAVALARLRAAPEYVRAFRAAYGRGPVTADLARALAAYVASIMSGDAPFDRYASGDTTALSTGARLGRRLFVGRANCASCHVGPNFSDERFHNTGVAWRHGAVSDSGRARVTGQAADVGAFRTPTLREVARTAPYMHDGSLATLEDVVDFYDRGGHPSPGLDIEIRPLRLTPEEKGALVQFLRALSGRVREGV
jgi:cytochrome c peroxidase